MVLDRDKVDPCGYLFLFRLCCSLNRDGWGRVRWGVRNLPVHAAYRFVVELYGVSAPFQGFFNIIRRKRVLVILIGNLTICSL